MSDSWFYLKMGWEHIISLDALDHQLFILALTILFTLKQWKQVLILVTAFTIGHSVTLALSTLNLVVVPDQWVEFLIPCTIAITALGNILKKNTVHKAVEVNYFFALFFGLIHGFGFANILKFMLARDQSMGWSLLAFNVGLEIGQILVVLTVLVFIYFLLNLLKLNQRYLVIIASAIILVVSLKMAIERFPSLT